MIIGVTGKIGSGKSSACKMLKEHLNRDGISTEIIDTDSLFKMHVKNNHLYIDSMERCCGMKDVASKPKADVIKMMNRMTIKKYIQYIHNINYHMYPVIEDVLFNTPARVVIIESALLLDTPLAFQCNQILEISVSRSIREERALTRDKDIRSEEATLDLIKFQEKYLTYRYRSTLNMNKDKIIRQFKVTNKKDTEFVDMYLFLKEYSTFLKTKLGN